MLLTKLSIENFGLFEENYSFDLTTKDPLSGKVKPIILFGGKNGAGKTTLFEAFRICLYGNTLPEFRLRKVSYEEYIKRKVHRSPSIEKQSASAAISLDFEYARLGKVDRYNIERKWHVTHEEVDEQFHVTANGKDLEELEKSQWQDFVNEMIPIGVSKLFFFDGEQIQVLAEDETDEIHLKDSFFSLLGLDLVDRLRSDLDIRLAKSVKDANSLFGKKFDDITAEKQRLEEEKERILQDNAHQKNILEIRKKTAARLEDELSREGGHFAKKRDELKDKKSLLEAKIEQVDKQIVKLCESLLPFTFAPQYCILLKKRLIEEEARQSAVTAASQVNKVLTSVEKATIARINNLDIGREESRKLISDIKQIFNNAAHTGSKESSISMIHHLSRIEQAKVLSWIESVLDEIPLLIKDLTNESERLTTELQKTADLLNKAPADEVIGPIFKEISTVNRDIGNIEAMIKSNTEKISQIDYKMVHVNASLRDLDKERREHTSLERGLALAQKVQDALEEYETRLKKEKLEQLSESLSECLNELMHKEIFQRVSINPDTFAVTLYDKGNNAVSKDQLSAGEKQIYAIAILWALARTSGRPLPFIIDTPLGRLDSDHRLNLVQNFFPVASHQVIIFSTDTEIDEKYFEELSEHIAHSYKLEYDSQYGKTKIQPGYFWRNKEVIPNELQ